MLSLATSQSRDVHEISFFLCVCLDITCLLNQTFWNYSNLRHSQCTVRGYLIRHGVFLFLSRWYYVYLYLYDICLYLSWSVCWLQDSDGVLMIWCVILRDPVLHQVSRKEVGWKIISSSTCQFYYSQASQQVVILPQYSMKENISNNLIYLLKALLEQLLSWGLRKLTTILWSCLFFLQLKILENLTLWDIGGNSDDSINTALHFF